MADPADIRDLLAEAHERGRPGGSSAGAWLLENARVFAAELAKYRKVSWGRIARGLFERFGVCGLDGGPLSGAALQLAWYRVRVYLADKGEDWVEFKDPPRGAGRLVKRKRTPKRAAEPAQAEAASVSVQPSPLGVLLGEADKDRPWVSRAGRKG